MNTNEQARGDSANEFAPENEQQQQTNRVDSLREDHTTKSQPATTRRNLDTGEDEPFDPASLNDESIMDFGSGSGGGSAGDGGGA
jgi:hypothetical protein